MGERYPGSFHGSKQEWDGVSGRKFLGSCYPSSLVVERAGEQAAHRMAHNHHGTSLGNSDAMGPRSEESQTQDTQAQPSYLTLDFLRARPEPHRLCSPNPLA